MEVDLNSRTTVGVDIGGANLKLSDSSGQSLSAPFPMWLHCERLGSTLETMLTQFSKNIGLRLDALALTMTGELADCFPTRRVGVEQILAEVRQAFPEDKTFVYGVDGSWSSPSEACRVPWKVAASNWHALASWAHQSQLAHRYGSGLNYAPQAIVDVGSTTVDIIPLNASGVATAAVTDRERMQFGQLVYTGMQRTPVAAMLASVQLKGVPCPLMAERFATSDDAYLTLGWVDENPEDNDTADGRPRTVDCARARLARMVGEDIETLDHRTIQEIAEQIISAQATQVASALARNVNIHLLRDGQPVHDRPSKSVMPVLLVSGHGRPLIQQVTKRLEIEQNRLLWLEEALSPSAARAAPAMAVAWLLTHARHKCR